MEQHSFHNGNTILNLLYNFAPEFVFQDLCHLYF
jgi:hypothetical protein